MIVVTNTENHVAHYLFDDGTILNPDELGVDTNAGFRIGHLNINNVGIYENVTPPEDWQSDKYTFDGQSWELAIEDVFPSVELDVLKDITEV